MNLYEIADVVETEGLEYALLEGYVKPDDFEDDRLVKAAWQALTGLEIITMALEEYLP